MTDILITCNKCKQKTKIRYPIKPKYYTIGNHDPQYFSGKAFCFGQIHYHRIGLFKGVCKVSGKKIKIKGYFRANYGDAPNTGYDHYSWNLKRFK